MKITTKPFKNLLAIESATSLCSVALRSGKSVAERSTNAIGRHSSAIFTLSEELLTARGLSVSDLDGVVIGVGPGSYTGLRVAASAVKGLLFGQDVPLFGVNTLAGFAAGIREFSGAADVHVIIDARRTHVYTQSFSVEMPDLNSKNIPEKQELSHPDFDSPRQEEIEYENSEPIRSLLKLEALNEPELIEIDRIYNRFNEGDILIGTGISRLEASKIAFLNQHGINETSAVGLIRIMDAGFEQYFDKMDVSDFELTYTVREH